MTSLIIYALSDSIGETAEMVARATASQFEAADFEIRRVPYINSVDQIQETMREAAKRPCVICHTLVLPHLRDALLATAGQYNIPTIDIMGPMIEKVQTVSQMTPKLKPGLVHKLDKDYFRRVEAVEFAVKYDDGKNPGGLLKADIVIIGVSRTSKTPLCMYLAHKRLKAANVPLVPEVPLPAELYQVPPERIVGLIIEPYKLNEIRAERLKVMGLGADACYANVDRITEELQYAKEVMRKLQCPVIDVSNKAIEETANRILEVANKKETARQSR